MRVRPYAIGAIASAVLGGGAIAPASATTAGAAKTATADNVVSPSGRIR